MYCRARTADVVINHGGFDNDNDRICSFTFAKRKMRLASSPRVDLSIRYGLGWNDTSAKRAPMDDIKFVRASTGRSAVAPFDFAHCGA